ncbi:YciI family protein [Amycolatopsis sp. 195334CR]|uniref:YciI family protein n=1 Tax=Amycolatopsis sp. 195334CR TaxID=2814588 RepID=UPI001A8C7E77|nr:YciI family protein [Amycolatopsis sp. 195334CR]MBN6040104.1 YciI family protein [Amycolatopsis sp. 195334CR]
MKYLILIYSNPESRELWASFSAEQRSGGWEAYAQLNHELAASGELIVTEPVEQGRATRVLAHDGKTTTTDGPFAEVKEQLAGFYLVECADERRAVEIAARVPEAAFGLVEVRPVLTP